MDIKTTYAFDIDWVKLSNVAVEKYGTFKSAGDACGMNPDVFRNYTTGNANPCYKNMKKICDTFGIKPSRIMRKHKDGYHIFMPRSRCTGRGIIAIPDIDNETFTVLPVKPRKKGRTNDKATFDKDRA